MKRWLWIAPLLAILFVFGCGKKVEKDTSIIVPRPEILEKAKNDLLSRNNNSDTTVDLKFKLRRLKAAADMKIMIALAVYFAQRNDATNQTMNKNIYTVLGDYYRINHFTGLKDPRNVKDGIEVAKYYGEVGAMIKAEVISDQLRLNSLKMGFSIGTVILANTINKDKLPESPIDPRLRKLHLTALNGITDIAKEVGISTKLQNEVIAIKEKFLLATKIEELDNYSIQLAKWGVEASDEISGE